MAMRERFYWKGGKTMVTPSIRDFVLTNGFNLARPWKESARRQ